MLVLAHLSMVSVKEKSSGKDLEDKVLSLWNVLQSLQVVRVGSAACTAFIGSFKAAVAYRRAAAFSGVISVMVIEVQAAAALQLSVTLVLLVVTPVVEGWLLQAAAALCYPNALVDVLFHPVCRFLFDPGGLDSGLEWACSGTSDLVHATC